MYVKTYLQFLIFGFAAVMFLSACQPVASPLLGILHNDTKYGDTATPAAAATKEGKACAQSILGLVATGDASLEKAKSNGGITTVSHVDHSAKHTLGIVGEWCTIVKGN